MPEEVLLTNAYSKTPKTINTFLIFKVSAVENSQEKNKTKTQTLKILRKTEQPLSLQATSNG